jgi:hypothetical protein
MGATRFFFLDCDFWPVQSVQVDRRSLFGPLKTALPTRETRGRFIPHVWPGAEDRGACRSLRHEGGDDAPFSA